MIIRRINKITGFKFNTCLLNYYRDGLDYCSPHSDKEVCWEPSTGVLTLSFGSPRDFIVKSKDKIQTVTIQTVAGEAIHLKPPTNNNHEHSVPKRTRLTHNWLN